MISVSVVSHEHGSMVGQLIQQLLNCPEVTQIILTRNIPEFAPVLLHEKLEIIYNPKPSGFGANHNAAFKLCSEPFFCVVNPDIELTENPFPGLLAGITEYNATVTVPLVVSPDNAIEDSIRRFPTVCSLLAKALGGSDGRYTVKVGDAEFCPEWAAGMFMLFSSTGFKEVGGFDTGYFLYYEDVDICVRAWTAGLRVVACPSVSVVHAAHRESHHNWRFMRWHLTSMARYFIKHLGRLPDVRKIMHEHVSNRS